jgi:large subunit ribosomal protein L19
MKAFNQFVESQLKTKRPVFGPGDQVRGWYKIQEKDRVRLAPFEGLVIRRKGAGISETFTVRRLTYGEGVERVFPLHTPVLDRIEVLRRGNVKRARLYYLRTKIGKTRISAADLKAAVSNPEEASASPQPAHTGDEPKA